MMVGKRLGRFFAYLVIVIGVALFVSSCGFTPQGEAMRKAIKEYGADAYDEGLKNAEWWICEGSSVASVRRRYGRAWNVYRSFCGVVGLPGPEGESSL